MEDLNYDHCAFTRYFVPDIELSVLMRNNMEQFEDKLFYF